MSLQKTDAIVLKKVHYGDTSLIATLLTQKFGLQSYMIKGVRSKKSMGKLSYFNPGSLLSCNVYHYANKPMQFVKDYSWKLLPTNSFTDVVKYSVLSYFMELLAKCIVEPESFSEVYDFAEDIITEIEQCDPSILANLPIYIATHLPSVLGLQLQNNYSQSNCIFDLQEGYYCSELPAHQQYIEKPLTHLLSQIQMCQQPTDLARVQSNGNVRSQLLDAFEKFYQYHFPGFSTMKTLQVLRSMS
jgi:DNA repair protein RecO (recombination protein O)